MKIQYHFYVIPAGVGKPECNHDKPLKLPQTEEYSTK